MNNNMIELFRKFPILFVALKGWVYKFLVDIHVINFTSLPCGQCDDHLIVSLTSYGRRVEKNVVYYTIVSLLRQKVKPDRIILWLSETEWNDDNLPLKLRKLKQYGVDICYCKDIKSYKKLIPTLIKYPNSTIVTFDDDEIYSRDTLHTLLLYHNLYPKDIICLKARKPYIEGGYPILYHTWKECANEEIGKTIIPIGVGGILYPPGVLCKDVTREDLFMDLCPMADDIWFWYCGLESDKRYVKKKGINLSFDILYQYFHRGSALTHNNCKNGENDLQFRRLFDYYNYKMNG